MMTSGYVVRALALAAALASMGARAEAQRAYQLKEINSSFNAAAGYPNEFVEVGVGDVVVFSAVDRSNDRELWVSDGTTLGTYRLKDINPGPASSDPLGLTLMKGVAYFAAKQATGGPKLWRTDGTEAGTYLVAPGASWSSLSSLTAVGDSLFFSAYDPIHGLELWMSDGTDAGTALVNDAVPGSGSSSPSSLRDINGVVYFAATTAATGMELWRSDGTSAGTYIVRDVNAGTADSSPVPLGGLGGLAFFAAYTPAAGRELWATDGTPAGTHPVVDLLPGSSAGLYYTPSCASYDGSFYFQVQQASASVDGLWRTDGTVAGTTRLTYLRYGGDLTPFGGLLYFSGQTGSTSQLWRTDGTASGTSSVSGLPYDPVYGSVHGLTVVGSTIFFFGNDQLWASDGSPENAHLVKDILPGAPYSNMRLPASGLGRLFFSADDQVHGQEPWISDGTVDGTNMLKDIRLSPNSGNPSNFAELSGTVLFAANDGVTGLELWRSDGTNQGTLLVKDLTPGATGSAPTRLTRSGGHVYFAAQATTTSSQLWRTDGTSAGTVVVGSFLGTNSLAVPDKLTDVNGTLFFAAAAGFSGVELWKTSGGWATLVKDLRSFYGSNPANLTALGSTLYFTATDNVGTKLFRTDGTEAGTLEAPQGSLPFAYASNLAGAGGKVFFSAYNAGFGTELWSTDGSAAGTLMVADINPAGSSNPANITVVEGVVYFTATDGVTGVELWRSDGTSAGTTQVADLWPGATSSSPSNLRPVGGLLFFTATDGETPATLWSSDGTAGGTVRVRDVATGATLTSPQFVADANGTALFQANDGVSGAELWSSDGASGTAFQVQDIDPGAASGAPAFVTTASGRVYFAAADGLSGAELWSLSNLNPVANAGPDQTVTEAAAATLDALGSTDPDADALTYEWRTAQGVLIGRGGQVSAVLPTGVHTVTLTARDGFGGIATDSVVITVRANVTLTLNVSGEEGGSGGIQADAHDLCSNPATGTLTCSFAYPADAVAQLVALASADSVFLGWSGACTGRATTCDITMTADAAVGAAFRIRNRPPVASAGGPYSGVRGQSIAFSGAGSSDPDDDPLTYAWGFGDGTTGTGVAPTHEYAVLGTYTLTLTVNDATVDSAPVTSTVTISNRAPVANPGGPYSGTRLAAVAFNGSASSDPDDDALSYAWSFGDGGTGTGIALTHLYATLGSFTATLTVNDGTTDSVPVTTTVEVTNVAPAVELTSPAPVSVFTVPANVSVAAEAGDSDGAVSKVEFYAGTLKIGEALGAPYAITWSGALAGAYSLTAVVTDSSGATATSAPVVVVLNAPPTVTLTAPTDSAQYAAPATIAVTASAADADGSITQVQFFRGTTSLGVDTTSPYSVTWPAATAGSYALTAVATDDLGAVVTSSAITVKLTAALAPTADSYVRASSANSNFGTAAAVTVQRGNSTSNQRWTYVKFDLASVPTLTDAKLRLFGGISTTTSTVVQTAVYSVGDTTWTEAGLTWNNKPASGTTPLASVTIVNNSTTARWYELDVTAYLQAEKAAGRDVVTLALKNLANSTPYVTFSSKEASTAANRPQLLLVP